MTQCLFAKKMKGIGDYILLVKFNKIQQNDYPYFSILIQKFILFETKKCFSVSVLALCWEMNIKWSNSDMTPTWALLLFICSLSHLPFLTCAIWPNVTFVIFGDTHFSSRSLSQIYFWSFFGLSLTACVCHSFICAKSWHFFNLFDTWWLLKVGGRNKGKEKEKKDTKGSRR